MSETPPLLDPALAGQRVVKRSLSIAGHATSVSLEPLFWERLKASAARRGLSLAGLAAAVDRERRGPLSSALRLFVLDEALKAGAAESSPSRRAADPSRPLTPGASPDAA